jgi:hypothetical protein
LRSPASTAAAAQTLARAHAGVLIAILKPAACRQARRRRQTRAGVTKLKAVARTHALRRGQTCVLIAVLRATHGARELRNSNERKSDQDIFRVHNAPKEKIFPLKSKACTRKIGVVLAAEERESAFTFRPQSLNETRPSQSPRKFRSLYRRMSQSKDLNRKISHLCFSMKDIDR